MTYVCKTAILERLRKNEPLWGSWKIKEFIGAGAHGCVYKIEKLTQGHRFYSAVKVIPITQQIDRRFKTMESVHASVDNDANEILLLYKLGVHQHILTWYDHEIFYHQDDNSLTADICLRLEYLPNSLSRIITKGPVPWRRTLEIMLDCLKGLNHIHSRHIIHRDIKPENIFVTEDGRAKIGDFGVARKITETEHAETRIGTPLYIAPEVIRDPLGDGYDQRVDIYSLGLVAYEMLTGKLPFEDECGESKTCMVKKRLSGQTIAIDRFLPDGVQKAVLGALAFDPRDRYATAWDFHQALETTIATGGAETIKPVRRSGESEPRAVSAPPSSRKSEDSDEFPGARRSASMSRNESTPMHEEASREYAERIKSFPASGSRSSAGFNPMPVFFLLAALGSFAQYKLRGHEYFPLAFILFQILIPAMIILKREDLAMPVAIMFTAAMAVENFLYVGSILNFMDAPSIVLYVLYFGGMLVLGRIVALIKERTPQR